VKDIILLGPKHSGKTSVGKALAALCSCEFIDLDEAIQQQSGKSPRELYRLGPEIFKNAEAQALSALFEPERTAAQKNVKPPEVPPSNPARQVIALGGGIADNPAALALLEKAENTQLICLEASVDTAWERISAGKELPPFLQTENPKESHRILHERRAALYRRLAKSKPNGIIINTEGKKPQEIAREIGRIVDSR